MLSHVEKAFLIPWLKRYMLLICLSPISTNGTLAQIKSDRKVCHIFSSLGKGELSSTKFELSHPMGKKTICICEIKNADQLRGYREADQRLCFRYTDSTIPLLLKSEISSF